jgi:hypothetical protein
MRPVTTPLASDDVPARPDAADPWRAAARIGRQLGLWSLASVAVGTGLLWMAEAEGWRAFGWQALLWGAIDGVIALVGARALRGQRRRGEVGDPARVAPERRRLRRLLVMNAGLDVGYVLVGIALLIFWRTEAGAGHGWGVVVQGGFLLVFDAWHAWRLREPTA